MLNPIPVFSVGLTPGSLKLYVPQSLGFAPSQNLPDGELLGVSGTISAYPSWYLAKCDLKGNVKTIYAFPPTETLPVGDAIYGADGNYYGLSVALDASGYVYRVTPSGALTKLTTFPGGTFGGMQPFIPLRQANDGNLYGVTASSVANAKPTFYQLTLAGQYTPLYTFPQGLNYEPTAMIEASDGNFYVSTRGSNIIRLTKSGQYSEVYTMYPPIRDGTCQCQLTQGSDGMIYGSALYGGAAGGGDIFAINAGLPKPAPRVLRFNPTSGTVGTQVVIWGTNLLSASVAFNGVTATTVSNSGPNYVLATVPSGASSGPITVTTPGGTYTTKSNFTVN